MPVSPMWAAHRLVHFRANSLLTFASGRNEAEKVVIRPAERVPTMRSAGISTWPISCVDKVVRESRISSRTAGLGALPAAISSLTSFCPRRLVFFFCFQKIHRKTSLPAVCIISPVYHIYFCRILQQFSWVHPRGITGREDSVRYTTESKNLSTYIDKKVL